MEFFMLPPVRCTCLAVIGNKYNDLQDLLATGISQEDALNMLNIKRYCCRQALMSPVKIPFGPRVTKRTIQGYSDCNIEEPRKNPPIDILQSTMDTTFPTKNIPQLGKYIAVPRESIPNRNHGKPILDASVNPATSQSHIPSIETIRTMNIQPIRESGKPPETPSAEEIENELEVIGQYIQPLHAFSATEKTEFVNVGAGKQVPILEKRIFYAR